MSNPTVERPPSPDERPAANERFRTRGRDRLYAGLALSAAVHVVLVLAWPDLSPSAFDPGFAGGATALELVAVAPARPPGERLVALPLSAEEEEEMEEEETSPDEADGEGAEEGKDGPAGSTATRGDRRTDDLQRIASVRAGVVERRASPPTDPPSEPSAEDETTDTEAAVDEDVRLRAASSRLHARLSEEDLLRLERLASVRPELAFGSTSSWLVLQNPSAVKDFMRRRFGRGREGGPAHGRLSVSLWVDERGSVEWAEINRSSGRPDLDTAALELFENVVAFTPARDHGMGVATAAVFWLQW